MVRPLPDALIDQIAAGEVVERPASVVKELVENALDAGATRLRIELREGGRELVAVTDDGSGMTPEDARMALERHATSKLGAPEDLERIATFGFRGEALPAIASVSKLLLRTRVRGAAEAVELRVDHGRLVEQRAAGGPEGTRLEVADLFAGVPARRKFLKRAGTEWGHASDWLVRAALARPDVSFELRRDERAPQVWPSCDDPLDRLAAVLGEEEAAAMLPLAGREGACGVTGFVSRPDRHRANASGVYLFVNRRPVRDRTLHHALFEVARDWLPRGRYPSAVLFVEVPVAAVDVNVHPAKWEVRFADPQALHRLVRRAVRETAGQRRWALAGAASAEALRETPPARAGAPGPREGDRASAGASDWVFAGERASTAALPGLEHPADASDVRPRFGELRLLGQLLATYLILEAKDRLLLVDQHAAHERVLYERLRAMWRSRDVESQRLLAPVAVELDSARLEALVAAADALGAVGFELEEFGAGTALVRAVPALLAERDPAALVRDLADELAGAGGDAAAVLDVSSRSLEAVDRLFASLACHSARRRGDVLDPTEQRALLDALDAIPWAPTCPHGRPVAVPFELSEIERRFSRR